jgi:hypothetical protein
VLDFPLLMTIRAGSDSGFKTIGPGDLPLREHTPDGNVDAEMRTGLRIKATNNSDSNAIKMQQK